MNETEMEIQVRSCKTHDVRDINRNVEHLFLEQGAEVIYGRSEEFNDKS